MKAPAVGLDPFRFHRLGKSPPNPVSAVLPRRQSKEHIVIAHRYTCDNSASLGPQGKSLNTTVVLGFDHNVVLAKPAAPELQKFMDPKPCHGTQFYYEGNFRLPFCA